MTKRERAKRDESFAFVRRAMAAGKPIHKMAAGMLTACGLRLLKDDVAYAVPPDDLYVRVTCGDCQRAS